MKQLQDWSSTLGNHKTNTTKTPWPEIKTPPNFQALKEVMENKIFKYCEDVILRSQLEKDRT